MSVSPVARIEQLETIEKDVISILQNAGLVLQEIAKDRPSQKQVDQLTQQVMGSIKSVDGKLSDQIKYLTQVSTGHPHEGSSYPAQKVLQCAWHRLEHTKSRLHELDRLRQGGLTPAQKQQLLAAQQASKQQQQQQQPQQPPQQQLLPLQQQQPFSTSK